MSNKENQFGDSLLDWERIWVRSTPDLAAFLLTPQGHVSSWNPGGTVIYGFTEDEVLGRHYSVFFPEDVRASDIFERELDEARQRGSMQTEGWRRRKDGSVFWASVVTTALVGSHGELLGFAKVVRDETEKRKAHDAVIESERRFRLLVDGVTDYSIFMLSPEGSVTNWNSGARRIKGYTADEIVGCHFSRFYAQGAPQRALDTAREGRFEAEGWRVRRDGTRFWAHVIVDAIRDESGMLVGFAKITRDVTEKREPDQLLEQTQAALFQSQKMEAIGRLTGGVAHDFNNVLQVLRGNLELLQIRCARDDWTLDRLANAISAVERGAKLASQLLAFGRRQALRPASVNLAAMVRSMDELLRRALGETIEVETSVAGGLWNAFVDSHQLENVVLNLAINARDAMPDGGRLTLELANSTLDERYVRSFPDVQAGQYVMLSVTDTGAGMPPEVLEHAFDPFFTTKSEGEGTGLGLSMAYGFVKQSGGHIRIYSEVGHGTAVRVYLPRSSAEAFTPAARTNAPMLGGSETVLVVEDDLKVQETVVEMLIELGYNVLKANNSEQALVVLGSGVHIDLLFTDVVMPGPLKSPEMVRRAVLIQPHLCVLYTSGYTRNAIVHGGRLDPGVELLSKPYSREDLAVKIGQLLDARGGANAESSRPSAEPTSSASARRVLVVEDDKSSRDALLELLCLLGYHPTGVENASDAIETMNAAVFDVLLTDVRLPDMSGVDLARMAIARHPAIRVLFASGEILSADDATDFPWKALCKPYSLFELEEALRDAGRPQQRWPPVQTTWASLTFGRLRAISSAFGSLSSPLEFFPEFYYVIFSSGSVSAARSVARCVFRFVCWQHGRRTGARKPVLFPAASKEKTMSHVYLRSDCIDSTERRSQTSALFSTFRCSRSATGARLGPSLVPLIRQPPSHIHGP